MCEKVNIPIEHELESICQEIHANDLGLSQWTEIESDDMFQRGAFVGGFDADEQEFCFSYFAPNKVEYWFQFNLETAVQISKGSKPVLLGSPAKV